MLTLSSPLTPFLSFRCSHAFALWLLRCACVEMPNVLLSRAEQHGSRRYRCVDSLTSTFWFHNESTSRLRGIQCPWLLSKLLTQHPCVRRLSVPSPTTMKGCICRDPRWIMLMHGGLCCLTVWCRCGWPTLHFGLVRPVRRGMRCKHSGTECAFMHLQELRGSALSPGLPREGEQPVFDCRSAALCLS